MPRFSARQPATGRNSAGKLSARLAQVDALRRQAEEAGAAAKVGPDAGTLRRLEELASAVASARALREREAPHVAMTYEAGAEGRVTLDGAPLGHGAPTEIAGTAQVRLKGCAG